MAETNPMQLAPHVSTRVLTGQNIRPDDTPDTSEVTISIPRDLLVRADMLRIKKTSWKIKPDETGRWATPVPVSNDPDVDPTETPITVRAASSAEGVTFLVPLGDGTPLDIMDAVQVVPVPPGSEEYVLTGLTIGTLTIGETLEASITGTAPVPRLNLTIPAANGAVTDASAITSGTLDEARLPDLSTVYVEQGDERLTDERNPLAHVHDADDINTGTFPIGRGGTGAATPEGARLQLGAAAATDVASITGTAEARFAGHHKQCVIVGSSNATPGTFGPEFCSAFGLTERNYAIGGSAFTTAGSFQNQLATAASDAAFANINVGVVVIADSSNSIRAKQALGTTADACFSYARTTFPNARILMLPVIWPSDPASQAVFVPGGYQWDWHNWLFLEVDEMRTAARKHGVEFVDYSWTWLTGHNEWMEVGEDGLPNGGVHCNAAGYSQVAQWLGQHMRGASTRADGPWALATYLGDAQVDANLRPMSAVREGWLVSLEGGLLKGAVGAGGFTDLALLPLGYRPTLAVDVMTRYNGQSAAKATTIYPNGTIRLWENVPAGMTLQVTGTFRVG